MTLVGAVTATLKADASQWTRETKAAADGLLRVKTAAYDLGDGLMNVKGKNDELAKSLTKTSYAAKESDKASRALAGGSSAAMGATASLQSKVSRTAGALNSLGGVLAGSGTELGKWAAAAGNLFGAFMMGGPVMAGVAAVGAGIAAIVAHFSEVDAAAKKAGEAAETSLAALKKEVQDLDDALKALGRGVDVGRITAERELAQNQTTAQEKVSSFNATYGDATDNGAKIDNFRAMAETSVAAKKVVDAYDDVVASGEALAASQQKLADIVATSQLKQHLDDLKNSAAAAAAEMRKVADGPVDVNDDPDWQRKIAEMHAKENAAMHPQSVAYSDDGMGIMEQHFQATINGELQNGGGANLEAALASAIKLRDFADLIGDASTAVQANNEAIDIETGLRRIASDDFQKSQDAIMRDRAQLSGAVGSMGAAVIGGNGGAAAGQALGSLTGVGIGALAGDPSGLAGGAIGGALGSALGGLIDKMKPLTDAAGIFMDALTDYADILKPVMTPFIGLAQSVAAIMQQVKPQTAKIDAFIGQFVRIGAALVDLGVPFVALFFELLPTTALLLKGLEMVTPYLVMFARGLEQAVKSAYSTANQFVQLANSLGAHLDKFDSNGITFGSSCFTGRTLVMTPKGPRRIDELEVGDEVIAFDVGTGEQRACVITNTMNRVAPALRIVEADGVGEIETTDEHPFWIDGVGMVKAESIGAGDRLRTIDARHAHVVCTRVVAGLVETYNITVDGAHTYYVAPAGGSVFVLVHNDDKEKEALKAARDQANATKDNTKAIKDLTRSSTNLPLGEKVLRNAELGAGGVTIHGGVTFIVSDKQKAFEALADVKRLSQIAHQGTTVARLPRSNPDNKN